MPDGRGLACAAGGFHVDPWKPVDMAVITHGHADHATRGHARYICSKLSEPILRHRIGRDIDITALDWGEQLELGDATVSLHPAGHVLGSAQVRVEVGGRVWVAAGDYKRQADPTCEPFEVVPCDGFVTEATFALPIYTWQPGAEVAAEILAWWDANREAEKASVLCAYGLGKAQRVLGELARLTDRPVYIHGALEAMTRVYREAGVEMLPAWTIARSVKGGKGRAPMRGQLVLAPPGAVNSPWVRRLGSAKDVDVAFASGWMRVRGVRRRRGYDRGFVISDHADWPDLLRTIEETGATSVRTTHGYSEVLARHLAERGRDARPLETTYGDDEEAGDVDANGEDIEGGDA